MAYFFALFWNFVCCCIASSANKDNATTSIFLALAYIVVRAPFCLSHNFLIVWALVWVGARGHVTAHMYAHIRRRTLF